MLMNMSRPHQIVGSLLLEIVVHKFSFSEFSKIRLHLVVVVVINNI